MLQDTVERLKGLENLGAPVVVCNEAHRFMVAEQLRRLGAAASSIILEPVGRNTAPAVAVAALVALKSDGAADPILLVLPADHVIDDVPAFHGAARIALAQAADEKLHLRGRRWPETGYGYSSGGGRGPAYPVAQFVEKPDSRRARQFIESGEYFWNSGMFVFKARRYLEELKRLAPDILEVCEKAVAGAQVDLEFTRLPAAEFERCRSESIDYAVMEKTRDAVVVPLDAGWSDVGSWAALHEASRTDPSGNVIHGDVIAEDTHDCFLYSDSRLVATVGLGDHVVVETKDAVLVAPKTRVQDVKLLVNRLKSQQRGEALLHREVFRPWGSYDSLETGERFQVKRLTINPGASISLQLHHNRAEHWVVVAGTARITRDDEVFLLEENQSTYIPVGTKHRIENPGTVPVHIIEVQSGSYLGEDDIVRFEDRYGREGTNK
jgi:mannose-1-phosphate guanylyltransferase/mannose-6-phosphate isomerase